ncbi:MAG: glycosyltransferase family 4 protein [Acidobacteria bacterium]|nr:glycosyltransferase family 4 protein [Acidobacteriota bacterium]
MPTEITSPTNKVVVVHRGARDGYQVSRALSEAGLLDTLVTDLYWPGNRAVASFASHLLPASVRQMLGAGFAEGLSSSRVRCSLPSGPLSFVLDKCPRASFALRRQAQRWTDAELGRKAGRLATKNNSQLLSYSYYGFHAFSNFARPGILFQVHPHPASVRRILERELFDHPDCSASLEKEWEVSLPQQDFEQLALENRMAAHVLCASSFTRKTLIENGTPAGRIEVVHYGVDLERFAPSQDRASSARRGPLRLLFVGTINQRKGIKYLLQALRLIKSSQLHLTVCGRAVDDLALFQSFGSQIDLRPNISQTDLLAAYGSSDAFVFPSVAEGFAQVLLEALACGLPLISTTHTAAPDLIDDGIQGFVVEPRRPDFIAARIDWLLSNRSQLRDMQEAARRRAEEFTWTRFRRGIVAAVGRFLNSENATQEALAPHV